MRLAIDVGPITQTAGALEATAKAFERPQLQRHVRWQIAQSVPTRFELFIDNLAAGNRSKFWHMYEAGEIGNPVGRLFHFRTGAGTNASHLAYVWEYRQAVKPNVLYGKPTHMYSKGEVQIIEDTRKPHVFRNKAWLVESGAQVYIRRRKAQQMVFVVDTGQLIFTRNPIVRDFSSNPGAGQFTLAANAFFEQQVPQILADEGKKLEQLVGVKLQRFVEGYARRRRRYVKVGAGLSGAIQQTPLPLKEIERLLSVEESA